MNSLPLDNHIEPMPTSYEAGKCFNHAMKRWGVYDMIDGAA